METLKMLKNLFLEQHMQEQNLNVINIYFYHLNL
jgi:hypothetical protein